MLEMINSANRVPRLRNTLYGDIGPGRLSIALKAKSAVPIVNDMSAVISKTGGDRKKQKELIRNSPAIDSLGNG